MSERNPIGKTLQLLRAMLDSQDQTWGVRDLARVSNLKPGTVHRLLTLLQDEGLVEWDDDAAQYQIGAEFYRMAWQAETGFPIRTTAIRYMRELVDRCNETALLGLYSSRHMQMVFASMVDSSHPVRYVIPLNQWVPVYTSASGMAIMAYLPLEERMEIVRRTNLVPLTSRGSSDPIRLEEELARIRSRGYAWSHGQRTPGTVGVAAPIFWGPGPRVKGDLVLTIPEQRFDEGRIEELTELVIDYANQITERLGGRVPTQKELDVL